MYTPYVFFKERVAEFTIRVFSCQAFRIKNVIIFFYLSNRKNTLRAKHCHYAIFSLPPMYFLNTSGTSISPCFV